MQGTMGQFSYMGWTLFAAIDAIKAYDSGSIDSGVRDEGLRDAAMEYLKSLDQTERRKTCAEFARRLLSDEAITGGYGLRDVLAFAEWLDDSGIEGR